MRRPGAPSARGRVMRRPRIEVMLPAPAVLTAEQVQHLASLARITLTPDEVQHLTTELTAIVDSVAKVTEVATPEVPATSHPIPLQNVFRTDIPGEVLSHQQALSGAPEARDGRFAVSAILGEEQ